MVKAETYKVYKGIQKEIRFLLLERGIAMQFLGSSIIIIGIVLMLLGASFLSLLLCLGVLIFSYGYFKRKDKRNQKHNIKKKNINSKKPDIIRTKSMIVIRNERSLFNKG